MQSLYRFTLCDFTEFLFECVSICVRCDVHALCDVSCPVIYSFLHVVGFDISGLCLGSVLTQRVLCERFIKVLY